MGAILQTRLGDFIYTPFLTMATNNKYDRNLNEKFEANLTNGTNSRDLC